MAVAAASMRTYLRDVIGIGDPQERREAVQGEGLEILTDFLELIKKGLKHYVLRSVNLEELFQIQTPQYPMLQQLSQIQGIVSPPYVRRG